MEDRIRQTLTQLKIIDMNQPVGQLSGGQVKRVALAKVVINEPELLILDEPTNHLDIDMIEWLESYLQRSRMSLLMVTHDRYFLDKVCSKLWKSTAVRCMPTTETTTTIWRNARNACRRKVRNWQR